MSNSRFINVYEINDWVDVVYYYQNELLDRSVVIINNLQDMFIHNPGSGEMIATLINKYPLSCFIININSKLYYLGVLLSEEQVIWMYNIGK